MNLMQHVEPGQRALVRMTGLILVASGTVSILSGATGHNFASRLYTGGWLNLNDTVPGMVLLAVGLFLLRVSGGAPLWDQVRAIGRWSGRHWISVGVVAIGYVAWLALELVDKLLASPRWMHYGLSGMTTLIVVAGLLLWQNPQDQSASLWDQVRAMRHWGGRQWISVGLFVTALAAVVALLSIDPQLSLPWWIQFAILGPATLVTIAGLQLWRNGQDRSAQS
jgi:hypothetical protein